MAREAALQDRFRVVTSKLLEGELVEANITGAQHTEYMSVLAMATDEAESRHGRSKMKSEFAPRRLPAATCRLRSITTYTSRTRREALAQDARDRTEAAR